jgi:hypothetical protein
MLWILNNSSTGPKQRVLREPVSKATYVKIEDCMYISSHFVLAASIFACFVNWYVTWQVHLCSAESPAGRLYPSPQWLWPVEFGRDVWNLKRSRGKKMWIMARPVKWRRLKDELFCSEAQGLEGTLAIKASTTISPHLKLKMGSRSLPIERICTRIVSFQAWLELWRFRASWCAFFVLPSGKGHFVVLQGWGVEKWFSRG